MADLPDEARDAILTKIKAIADGMAAAHSNAQNLKDLAEAYALVTTASASKPAPASATVAAP